MTTKAARKRFSDATGNIRSTKKTCQLFGTALRRAMRKCGATVRSTAEWSGVSPTTVQKHRSKGMLIPYLRSERLAIALCEELLVEITGRNGRAA